MKQTATTFVLAILALMISTSVAGQKKSKDFTGVITYQVTYPDSDFDANMQAMLPTKMTATIGETKKKSEILSGMANQVEILDGVEKSRTTLIDMMGQKFAILYTWEDIQAELAEKPEPQITYLDETKEIAGYPCKKAEILTTDDKGKENTITIFFTEKIRNDATNFESDLRGVDGMVLEFVVFQDRVNMKFTASEVAPGKVKDKEFEIPEGFKYVTEDELKQMFGG